MHCADIKTRGTGSFTGGIKSLINVAHVTIVDVYLFCRELSKTVDH